MMNFPIDDLLLGSIEWVLQGTWRALPLVGIVLVIDLLFRRRIAARFHCLLWMVVAARMMFPVCVESSFSMDGWLQAVYQAADSAFSSPSPVTPGYNVVNSQPPSDLWRDTDTPPDQWQPQPATLGGVAGDLMDQPVAATSEVHALNAQGATVEPGFDWVTWGIVGTWFVVACGFLLRGLVQSARFALRLRRCAAVTEQAVVDQVLRACDALGLGRRPMLKEVDGLTVPAVFGIWRPTICLPTGSVADLSSDELRLVLLHEVAHVKRRDGLVLSLAMCVRAVHWFNPLAWLAVSRIRHYMEQAADDAALRRTPARTDYCHLLLKFAAQESGRGIPAAIGLLLTSPGRTLKQRIKMLDHNPRRNHWLARILAGSGVMLFAVGALTDASTHEPEPPRQINIPQVAVSFRPSRDPAAEPEVREATYDITKALEKVREMEPDADGTFISSMFAVSDNLRMEGNQLHVVDTEEQHEHVRGVLQAVEESGFWQITYSVRFIEVGLDVLSRVDIDWKTEAVVPNSRQANPVTLSGDTESQLEGDELSIGLLETTSSLRPLLGVKITETQVRRLFQHFQSDTRSNIFMAPKVTLFNGASCWISDETQRPFVTGVNRRREDGSMEPFVDVIPEGIRIRLHGAVTQDGRLAMKCGLMLSDIDDVELANLPFGRREEGPRAPVTVQVPQARTISVRADGILKRDESLLIVCPNAFAADQATGYDTATCFLVTPNWFQEY